jgi:hypothetical protein
VIALELLWIAVQTGTAPVSAQQAPAPTRVVITGIDLAPETSSRAALPVLLRATDAPLRVQSDPNRPIKIETDRPLGVVIDRPVKVEADKPLVVDVLYRTGQKPGE